MKSLDKIEKDIEEFEKIINSEEWTSKIKIAEYKKSSSYTRSDKKDNSENKK